MAKTQEAMRVEIDQVQLMAPLDLWRVRLLENTKAMICADRAVLAMEAWKENEGKDIEIRRAMMTKKILECLPIAIHACDWTLVGRNTQYIRGGNPRVDIAGNYIPALVSDGEMSVGSPVVRGMITEDERKALKEAAVFFGGKTVGDHLEANDRALAGDWAGDLIAAKGVTTFNRSGHVPGVKPDWQMVMGKGLRGIINDAKANIQRFIDDQETDVDKVYFWQAVIIVCEAVIAYARRHAALAKAMAAVETDAVRKKDLESIAATCEWVPENPPRTLQEAAQVMVFLRITTTLECSPQLAEMGRVDQDLWPYFEKDVLRDGTLSLAQATDIIGRLLIFFGSMHNIQESAWMDYAQTAVDMGSVTIGGQTRDGKDATNLLSYIVLHAEGLLCIPEPHIALRWHKNTPDWIMKKAIETNVKTKSGFPQFMNDEHVIDMWTKEGLPIETARDWFCQGCANAQPQDRIWHAMTAAGEVFNVALFLDLALHDGVAKTGKQIGPHTGDPRNFGSFEALLDALRAQESYITHKHRWLIYSSKPEQYLRRPLMSAVLSCHCMERGQDIMFKDPNGYLYEADRAVVDTGDALMSIKKLVYDDKLLTMDELLEALDSNFAGERGEEIRQMCLNVPKFGNDIEEVDELVKQVGILSSEVIRESAKAFAPDQMSLGTYRGGLSWHYYGGKGVRAMANGRKDGEPLYDGSFSPMAGMDTGGPTSTLNSVIRSGFNEANVSVLNQKFSGTAMSSPESQEKLLSLTKIFLENDGSYVQYNLVDAQELRDAQEHPEKHRDLLVRVGGFSAYFVTLTKDIQNDIICRTEQTI